MHVVAGEVAAGELGQARERVGHVGGENSDAGLVAHVEGAQVLRGHGVILLGDSQPGTAVADVTGLDQHAVGELALDVQAPALHVAGAPLGSGEADRAAEERGEAAGGAAGLEKTVRERVGQGGAKGLAVVETGHQVGALA